MSTSHEQEQTPAIQRQRASWTELFFDLVFVVTIAQLAHHLEGNPGLADFGEFVVLFAAPWWAWLQFTAFTTQFGTADTARGRLLMLAAMAGMGVMGAAIPDALHSRADVYALGYASSRAVVFLMWLPTAHDEGQAWHLRRVTVFNGVPFLLWGGSILVPMPWQAAVWMASLLFELLFLIRLQGRDESEAPYQVSHVVERVGLFVMIVLGESVAASINGLDEHWSAAGWLILGFGFVLFAAIWWGYFTVASQAAETALREGENAHVRDVLGFGHFPLITALTAMAAGLGTAVAHPDHLPHGAAVALCGGLAMLRLTYFVLAVRLGRGVRESLPWTVPGVAAGLGTLALHSHIPAIPAWSLLALLAAEATAQQLTAARPRLLGAGRIALRT